MELAQAIDPVASATRVNKRNTICPQCGQNLPVDQFPEHFRGHSEEKLTPEQKAQQAAELKAKEEKQAEQIRLATEARKAPPKPTPEQRKRQVLNAVQSNLQTVIDNALKKIDSEEQAGKQSEEEKQVQSYYKGVSTEFLAGEPIKLEESFETIPQPNRPELADPDIQKLKALAVDQTYAQSYKLKYSLTRVLEVNKNQSQEIQALRDTKRDFNEGVSFGVVGYAEDHRYILEEPGRNIRGTIRNWGLIIALIVSVILVYEYENSPQLQAEIANFWANDLNKAIVVIAFLAGLYILYKLNQGRKKKPSGAV